MTWAGHIQRLETCTGKRMSLEGNLIGPSSGVGLSVEHYPNSWWLWLTKAELLWPDGICDWSHLKNVAFLQICTEGQPPGSWILMMFIAQKLKVKPNGWCSSSLRTCLACNAQALGGRIEGRERKEGEGRGKRWRKRREEKGWRVSTYPCRVVLAEASHPESLRRVHYTGLERWLTG